MPTRTESHITGSLADIPAQLLKVSTGAIGASAELYLDGIDTVASLQRSLVRGTPLESLSEAVSYQTGAARELVRAYLAVGEQTAGTGGGAAEVADQPAARVARRAASAATKATKRPAGAARRATKQATPSAPATPEPPIAGYASLTADELVAKLPELSQSTLAEVAAYEKANESRSTVLDRVAALSGPEPAPGYDELTAEDVQKLLTDGDAALATRVRDYERRHKGRTSILDAAARQLGDEA